MTESCRVHHKIMTEELLDIVNENDEVIGSQPRSAAHPSINPKNWRAVNVFIKNSQGQLWVPRRTATKTIFPSCLDFSVGGHVQHGDGYKKTLFKETLEEVNLDLNEVPYEFVGKLTPKEHGVAAFMEIYQINYDHAPDYNPEDFTEYYWFTPEQLIEKIEQGEKVKGDVEPVIRYLFL